MLYATSTYLTWRRCVTLHGLGALMALLAVAFLPFWYLVMNGRSSAFVLFVFTATWLALERRRRFQAGLLLGLVFYKPQLGIAVATFVLLGQGPVVTSAVLNAAAQWGLASVMLGSDALREYLDFVVSFPSVVSLLQPKLSQLHSLKAFFDLLLPGPLLATAASALTAKVAVVVCVKTRRRRPEPGLAVAQLLLTTVRVSPHLFVYDLVLLANALMHVELSRG